MLFFALGQILDPPYRKLARLDSVMRLRRTVPELEVTDVLAHPHETAHHQLEADGMATSNDCVVLHDYYPLSVGSPRRPRDVGLPAWHVE